MKFKDREHEAAYKSYIARCKTPDEYHQALFYLLALSDTTRCHIEQIYDFPRHRLADPNLFKRAWQTSSTERITHLAVNLFTDSIELDADDPDSYSVSTIFTDLSDAPYFWEAIKLRYPEINDITA